MTTPMITASLRVRMNASVGRVMNSFPSGRKGVTGSLINPRMSNC
jgi:hypothetical protein